MILCGTVFNLNIERPKASEDAVLIFLDTRLTKPKLTAVNKKKLVKLKYLSHSLLQPLLH